MCNLYLDLFTYRDPILDLTSKGASPSSPCFYMHTYI